MDIQLLAAKQLTPTVTEDTVCRANDIKKSLKDMYMDDIKQCMDEESVSTVKEDL